MATATIDFDELVREHRARMVRIAYNRTGSWADAEDAVQNALIKAWEQRDTYRPRGDSPPVAWVTTLAKYQALRAAGWYRRNVPAGDWAEQFADDQEGDDTGLPCMAEPETMKKVRAAVATLPPRMRFAVEAYCLNGTPIGDIAEQMGTSRHAVWELLLNAFRRGGWSGPAWRHPMNKRGVDSPEAEMFRSRPEALAALTRSQREVVRLRYVDRLPLNAVAERLGLTRKGVSEHQRKARRVLDRLMSAAVAA